MIKKVLLVFADGGARGNPGPAATGFLVKDEDGKVLVEEKKFIGRATNNVAEYMAVIEALTWIKQNSQLLNYSITNYKVCFFLDSQLVVNQLNGLYKVKNGALRNLVVKVRQLERKIGLPIAYQHIPRQKNKEADALVNQSLDASNF